MTLNRFKTPARSAMAATLAAALAFTPLTAAPAQAGNDEAVGAIAAASFFALLTAGVIASAATSGRDDAPRRADAPRAHSPRDPRPGMPRPGRGRDIPRTDPRKILPEDCEFTVTHGRDRGSYYVSQCLNRNFRYAAYLPDRCEERIESWGGRRVRAYDATCLARFGYTSGEVEDDRNRPVWGRR
jgi:hypothetical protein